MTDQPPQNATYGHDGTEPAPTAPQTLNGPQTATQCRWALDKIRETIGLWTGTYGWAATSPVRDLIRDLRAILDAHPGAPMTDPTPTPSEDPNLVRWTPTDGPLAEALAKLPDCHPVTIYGDVAPSGLHGTVNSAASSVRQWFIIDPAPGYGTAMWYVQEMAATGASWLPPGPAWDGALVVCDGTGDLFWRGPDGLYRSGTIGDSDASTASDVEANWPPVTVLIDSDGNHVEVPHA